MGQESPRESNRRTAEEGSLNKLNCLGPSPLVAMMQTSHLREFKYFSHLGRLNGPGLRRVFVQPQVSPASVIIGK